MDTTPEGEMVAHLLQVVRTIIPIQQQVDERRFKQCGSSVLLAIEGRHVLISAAHVVLDDELWLFSEPRNIVLEEIEFSSTSPTFNSANEDSTNIAFAELPKGAAEMLHNFGFESLEMKDTAYVSRPSNGRAAFSGFPYSKSNLDARLQRMKLQPGFIEGTLLTHDELAAAGLEPDSHLAIPYRRKRQFDVRRKLQMTGVHPRGMSGGPVWRFGNDDKPWLAGIGFKFDEQRELLVGTRIDHVFALIQQQSIERWLAQHQKPIRKMIFDLKTGKLVEDSEDPPL